MTDTINRRVVLAARPQGLPGPQHFRFEEVAMAPPADGEVLLRTLYLSLDPYMRQLMDETPPAYASSSVQLGDVMPGGTVSRVVISRHPQYRAGDLVLANSGWQDLAVSNGEGLSPIPDMAQPSLALGGLGMPAFTAYVGLLDIGQPRPGETVVVAAATGAVGAMVGQIAKLQGARVVGIAGGTQKCRFAVETLGFDACLDRHDPALAERLAEACPHGIDVYFENVGGPVFDAVFPLLNIGARIPVIGNIAHYNDAAPPPGPDRLPQVIDAVLQKRLRVQGLVILDHYEHRFKAFQRDMKAWLAAGRIRSTEDRVDGLQNAPEAFIGMLEGRNRGKVVVRVADASPPDGTHEAPKTL
jgi:NADPH-dependent curcumin reductase CurA